MASDPRIAVELRASCVAVRGDEILLIRHTRGDQSYWVLPGGHPEAGEIAAAAVRREVSEETGLRVEPGSVVFVWEGIAPHGERRIIEVVFEARLLDRDRPPRSESALEVPAFVPFDDLGSIPLYPPVAGYLRGAHQRGFGDGAKYLGNVWRSMRPLAAWD